MPSSIRGRRSDGSSSWKGVAMWTIGFHFESYRLIVFAKYDSRLIFCDVLWTHVGVHWDMVVAMRVVGVLVVAHDVIC